MSPVRDARDRKSLWYARKKVDRRALKEDKVYIPKLINFVTVKWEVGWLGDRVFG